MDRRHVLEAYISGLPMPDDPALSMQSEALYVDSWWPAAVRLGPKVHLVRIYDDGPQPELSDELAQLLAESGLEKVGNDWPLIESVTLQRLGVLGGRWQVWAESEAEAETAVSKAAIDMEEAPQVVAGPESSFEKPDLTQLLHELGFELKRRFGDREPTDEEARKFMIDWLVSKGNTEEQAEAILGP